MFFAHLPAGYLLTSALSSRRIVSAANPRMLMIAGLAGSLFPDLDLVYFYLFDQRQHHHHSYWTHLPVFWSGALALALLLASMRESAFSRACILGFGVNVLLHLVLDTLVGDIWWFYPFIDKPFALFTVPARYSPWWLNFVLHWSMALEVAIVLAAYVHLKRKLRQHLLGLAQAE